MKRTAFTRELLLRRKVLKGFGALAVSAPAFAVFACSSGDKTKSSEVTVPGTGGQGTSTQGSGGSAPGSGGG